MRRAIWLAAIVGLLALTGRPGFAASLPDVGDAVPGHPGVTYLDLLRQVVPDLKVGPDNKDIEGHLPRPLRHLAGKTYDGDPPDPVVAEGFLEMRRLTLAGQPRLVLLEDLGPDPDRAYDTALLALYDDTGAPRLLDAVDVGTDRDTAFGDTAVLDLGGGESALVTLSEHLNSNQAYDSWLLILPRADRFRMIDDIMLISDRDCGWDRRETPSFSTLPDPQSPYAQIFVTVSEKRTRLDEDCGDQSVPKPYSRIWRTVYRWDAKTGRYVDRAHGLDALQKANEARF
jgi:hypothetical protein